MAIQVKVRRVRFSEKRSIVIREVSARLMRDLTLALNEGLKTLRDSKITPRVLEMIGGGTPLDFPKKIMVVAEVASGNRFRVRRISAKSIWRHPVWVSLLSCESKFISDRLSITEGVRRWFFGGRLTCRRNKNKKRPGLPSVLAEGFESLPVRKAKLYFEVMLGDVSLRPLFSWELLVSFELNGGKYEFRSVRALGTCVPSEATSIRAKREVIGKDLLGRKIQSSVYPFNANR